MTRKITGIDIAITSTFRGGRADGILTVDFRHNWNEQKVSNVAGSINDSRVYDLENHVPEHSTVLTLDYARGMFDGLVRVRRYEDWSSTGGLFSPGDASDQYDYDGEILVDLEVSLTFQDNYRVSIGGENIFDTTPGDEQEPTLRFLGVDKSLVSPFGVNGGFWYARLSASF